MTLSAAAQLGAAGVYARRALVIRQALGAAALGAYDRLDDYSAIDPFLDQMVPMTLAAQRALASLLAGYLFAVSGARPRGLDLDEVTGDADMVRPEGLRHDWSIPFRSLAAALGAGVAFADAYARARADVEIKAHTDLAYTQSATMAHLGSSIDEVSGYRRVLAGPGCEFCTEASDQTYAAGDLMPLHAGCMSAVVPILGTTDPGRQLNAAVLTE